jgi:hypothetical protein
MLTTGQRVDWPTVQEHQERVRTGRRRPGQQSLQRRAVMGPGDHLDSGPVGPAEQLQRFVGAARPGPDQVR